MPRPRPRPRARAGELGGLLLTLLADATEVCAATEEDVFGVDDRLDDVGEAAEVEEATWVVGATDVDMAEPWFM